VEERNEPAESEDPGSDVCLQFLAFDYHLACMISLTIPRSSWSRILYCRISRYICGLVSIDNRAKERLHLRSAERNYLRSGQCVPSSG
jgi:hypothetical protein